LNESATKLQQRIGNHMKTRVFRIDWLIPVLGIALVGGGYFPMKSYLGLQEQIRSWEQLEATMDRLLECCDLSRVMVQAQSGGCASTARSLYELVAANLATESAGLASADPDARAVVERVAEYIDRRRSESPPMAGDGSAAGSGYEVAGQRSLTQTLTQTLVSK
jgi:hypothetical protein